MAELEGRENSVTRQLAMTMQWQQRVQEVNSQVQVLEEERGIARWGGYTSGHRGTRWW